MEEGRRGGKRGGGGREEGKKWKWGQEKGRREMGRKEWAGRREKGKRRKEKKERRAELAAGGQACGFLPAAYSGRACSWSACPSPSQSFFRPCPSKGFGSPPPQPRPGRRRTCQAGGGRAGPAHRAGASRAGTAGRAGPLGRVGGRARGGGLGRAVRNLRGPRRGLRSGGSRPCGRAGRRGGSGAGLGSVMPGIPGCRRALGPLSPASGSPRNPASCSLARAVPASPGKRGGPGTPQYFALGLGCGKGPVGGLGGTWGRVLMAAPCAWGRRVRVRGSGVCPGQLAREVGVQMLPDPQRACLVQGGEGGCLSSGRDLRSGPGSLGPGGSEGSRKDHPGPLFWVSVEGDGAPLILGDP